MTHLFSVSTITLFLMLNDEYNGIEINVPVFVTYFFTGHFKSRGDRLQSNEQYYWRMMTAAKHIKEFNTFHGTQSFIMARQYFLSRAN